MAWTGDGQSCCGSPSLERAAALGLSAEAGIDDSVPADDALARLSAYLCDVKDMQIRDGLHVFGKAPPPAQREAFLQALTAANAASETAGLALRLDASPAAEREALLAALDGRFVFPGPAGAPTRGRADVLPTGRNLFTVDPRAIPTRSATILAERAAAELLRRHMQDHGDWLHRIVIDLWGSTSMRTGGEDLALALTLMGVAPLWDTGSARVTGFEICRSQCSTARGSTSRCESPGCSVTPSRNRSSCSTRPCAQSLPRMRQCPGTRSRQQPAKVIRCSGSTDQPQEITAPASRRTPIPVPGRRKTTSRRPISRHRASSTESGRKAPRTPRGFAALVGSADAYLHIQDHAETDLLDGTDQAAPSRWLCRRGNVFGGDTCPVPCRHFAPGNTAPADRLRGGGTRYPRTSGQSKLARRHAPPTAIAVRAKSHAASSPSS